MDILIANSRAVLPEGSIVPLDVGIKDGRIACLCNEASGMVARRTIDAGGKYLLPGLIDCHVHYGYHPDDCLTETRSAVLGGITTALRFHRKMTPYDDEALGREVADVEANAYSNVAFHLTLNDDNQAEPIRRYVDRWGITSFKLITGFRDFKALNVLETDDAFLLRTMQRIARVPGAVVCVHCENTDLCEWHTQELRAQGRDDLLAWNESRPDYAEAEAMLRIGYLAKRAGCPLYIVHITGREPLAALQKLRRMGVSVAGETCVQYLTLTDEVPAGILAKVTPPLRKAADVDALWAAVEDGTLDTVATDHSPRRREEKLRPSVWDTMPGNVGIGTLLPLLLSEGVNKRGLLLQRLVEVTSANPARLFHFPSKGRIQVGADADLVLVDLDAEKVVRASEQASMSDYSLYEGATLQGWPVLTVVNGSVVAQEGRVVGQPGTGRYVRRALAAADQALPDRSW